MVKYSLPVTIVTSTITAIGEEDIADVAEKITRDYATNDNGEGLFVWSGTCWKQLLGNSQFRATNRAAMLRKTLEYRTDVKTVWTKKARADREAQESAYAQVMNNYY